MQAEDLYRISEGDTGLEVAEGINGNFDNILEYSNPIVVTMTEGMDEQQLKDAAMVAISALKKDSSRRAVIKYYNSLYPATTFISDSEFSISTIEYSPLAINNSDNSSLIKCSIYCKLSGGTITYVYGGVYNYEFAKQDEFKKYLPLSGGNITGDLSVGGNSVWHDGNFDPSQYFKGTSIGYLYDIETFSDRATGIYQVHATGAAKALIKFRLGTGSSSGLEILWDYLGNISARTTIDSNRYGDWVDFYTTKNLGSATSSSAGLMSASDKVKLDSLASAMSLSVIDNPTTLGIASTSENEESSSGEIIDHNVTVRAIRAAQYEMTTDELLYDALEQFAKNHPEYTEFSAWLAAKDAVREQLPYVDETTTEE